MFQSGINLTIQELSIAEEEKKWKKFLLCVTFFSFSRSYGVAMGEKVGGLKLF